MQFRFYNLNVSKSTGLPFQTVVKRGAKSSSHAVVREVEIEREVKASSTGSTNVAPIIKCKVPAFNFYVGQKYHPYQEIQLASSGWQHYKSKGDHFTIFPTSNTEECEHTKLQFKDLLLDNRIVDALHKSGYKKPMQMQEKAILPILNGQNTILAAETGSGKTLAYLLPMIHQVLCCKSVKTSEFNAPWGLVITPTRELAMQIAKDAEVLAHHLGIKVKTITGGAINKSLLNPPCNQVDILVCSFGALRKYLSMDIYKLHRVKHIVVDEADALFHEGFHNKVRSFFTSIPLQDKGLSDDDGLPLKVQLTLASATAPARINEVLGDFIDVDTMEQISTEKLHHVQVKQQFLRVGKSTKPMELLKHIKQNVALMQPVIVFTNHNKTCDFVSIFLYEHNIRSVNVHGTMPWKHRKGKLNEFLNGESLVLTTTNTASRGLNTNIVKAILNYDFPFDTAEYIHRCGRTGRPGTKIKECKVTNFIASTRDVHLTQKIEMAIRKGKPLPIIRTDMSHLIEEQSLVEDESDLEENYIVEDKEYKDITEEGSIPY